MGDGRVTIGGIMRHHGECGHVGPDEKRVVRWTLAAQPPMRTMVTLSRLGTLAVLVTAAAATQTAPELGRVRWLRDFESALAEAKREDKPVLALFQEVPGRARCVDFGDGPLSHPLLVDAIESEFVPVVIHNNLPGPDEEILKRYGEPGWSDPIVRFFDSSGSDILPRRAGVYSTSGVAQRLVAALEASRRDVPGFLRVALEESREVEVETATFAMHCFWTGEARLGALEGVVDTRPAHVGGHEVVEVSYYPEQVTFEHLVERADSMECASYVFARGDAQLRKARELVGQRARKLPAGVREASASDALYHLGRSTLRHVPLSRLQAIRINSALFHREDPRKWMSERQWELARRIAQTLKLQATAFDGLIRPAEVGALLAYETELAARIEAAEERAGAQ